MENEDYKNDSEKKLELLKQFDFIVTEVKQLNPYLNKIGQQKLTNILKKTEILNQYLPQSPLIFEKAITLNLKEHNLTNTELYLCVLISLKFSNSEIAHLSGFKTNYIRVTIHRICKKLSIKNRLELENKLG